MGDGGGEEKEKERRGRRRRSLRISRTYSGCDFSVSVPTENCCLF